jgi:hypothetical protein
LVAAFISRTENTIYYGVKVGFETTSGGLRAYERSLVLSIRTVGAYGKIHPVLTKLMDPEETY